MKRILLLTVLMHQLLFGLSEESSKIHEFKWDSREYPLFNEKVIPKDYNKNGLSSKIKEVEGEEVWYFVNLFQYSPHKVKARRFKENGKTIRHITYSEDTGKKVVEDRNFYPDENNAKKVFKITRKYFTSGAIKEESGVLWNGRKLQFIYSKGFYESGKLERNSTYMHEDINYDEMIRYDEDGNIEKEIWAAKELQFKLYFEKEYKNNILVKETTTMDDRPYAFTNLYDDNGTLVSQKYTNRDGDYSRTSFCSFDTSRYVSALEKKCNYEGYYKRRHDTYCEKMDNNSTYMIVTAYSARSEEGTKPEYLEVMLGLVDIKTHKFLSSYYDKNTSLGYEEQFDVSRFSYKSKESSNVIDVINTVFIGRWKTDNLYNSYKVAIDKIVVLKNPTFNLKDMEATVKKGKSLTVNTIRGMLNEIAIDKKTVVFYNNIAYYLQKNKLHKEAIFLLEKVMEEFPKRTVLYLNLGDSAWVLKKKELSMRSYIKYVQLMKRNNKERKIPKRVQKRLSEIKIK